MESKRIELPNDKDRRQREELGEDLAMSAQTPQSQWSGVVALRDTEVGEAGVRAALYGSSVYHAQGVHVDAHGSLLDVRRRPATRSRVVATLTGVSGVGVPALSRVRTMDGDLFESVSDAFLSPSGVDVEMQAVEFGPIEAPAGTLTEIVTVIAGWETVTNALDAIVGRARQTDDNYKAEYENRTAHSSIGPLSALRGALTEALAKRVRVVENNTNMSNVTQEWTVGAHSILVVAESGSNGDVRRAIENHRGMGVGTMTAIRAGAHDDTALAAISDGTINWNGTEYTGLDLSSATSGADRAAALTTLLAADSVPPTIRFIAGRYVAIHRWQPNRTPAFGGDDDEDSFGLDPDSATASPGPFVRTREIPLTVSFTLTRRIGFPADGLDRIRRRVLARVNGPSDSDIIADASLSEVSGYGIISDICRAPAGALQISRISSSRPAGRTSPESRSHSIRSGASPSPI